MRREVSERRPAPGRASGRAQRRGSVAAQLLLPLLAACAGGDRITLSFDSDDTRAEAAVVAIYAVKERSRSGAVVGCRELVGGEVGVEDEDVIVSQRSSVPLPVPPGQSPLLAQLPQGSYAFFAVARDRFDFAVAQGCREAEVSARSSLDLVIELHTLPAPSGRLEPVGATSLLQHAGQGGLERADALAVRALSGDGQPQPGIEVHVLVERGEALPLESVFLTGGDGVGSTVALAAEGESRLLLHARGLEGSPVTFELTGLPSVAFQLAAADCGIAEQRAVALVSGDYVIDDLQASDLVAVVRWAAAGEVQPGKLRFFWGGRSPSCEEPPHPDTVDAPTAAVAGHFDVDDRLDLAVAGAPPPPGEPPRLVTMHHDPDLGDRLLEAVTDQPLPTNVREVVRLLRARVNWDALDDLVLLVRADVDGVEQLQLLVYLGLPELPYSWGPFFIARMTWTLPAESTVTDIAVGDLDGDSDDDLLLLSPVGGVWLVPCGWDSGGSGGGRYFVPSGGDSGVPVLLQLAHLATVGATLAQVVDMDGDGFADVAVVGIGPEVEGIASARLQLARGNGTFDGLALDPPRTFTLDGVDRALLADFNADGHQDLVVFSRNLPQRLLLMGGDGTGRLASPLVLDMPLNTLVGMVGAYIDQDDRLDLGLLGTGPAGDRVAVLLAGAAP